MDYAKESLKMHYDLKGKIEVVSRAKVDSKDALSLAYTPGVAQPCLEIQKDVNKSYDLTRRWNTVAVVTDGPRYLDWEISDRKQVCLLWKVKLFFLKNLETLTLFLFVWILRILMK